MALNGEIIGSGVLQVHLVSAKDLYNTKRLRTMDPYCVIQLDQEKKKCQKTRADISGGKTPHWDETLTLNYEGEKHLDVELYDYDTLSSDDFIAHYRFPIRELLKLRGGFDGEVTLVRGKENCSAGRLKCQIELHGGDIFKPDPVTNDTDVAVAEPEPAPVPVAAPPAPAPPQAAAPVFRPVAQVPAPAPPAAGGATTTVQIITGPPRPQQPYPPYPAYAYPAAQPYPAPYPAAQPYGYAAPVQYPAYGYPPQPVYGQPPGYPGAAYRPPYGAYPYGPPPPTNPDASKRKRRKSRKRSSKKEKESSSSSSSSEEKGSE